MGGSKIPDFQNLDSHSKATPRASPSRDHHCERVYSHATASTSLRCGFKWLQKVLDHRLEEGEMIVMMGRISMSTFDTVSP